MASPRIFTPTLAVLAVAFAAAPWLFLAFPPWAASLAWAATAAVGVLAYLAERRRWHRDLETEALDHELVAEAAHRREEALLLQAGQAQAATRPEPVPDPDRNTARVRFSEAASFAGFSLVDSQKFTQGEVRDLLVAFESLGRLSLEVEENAARTFESLLDPSSPASLGNVVSESQTIGTNLGEFFSRLHRLADQTGGYLKTNADELARVKDMAGTIEEFFENIRMISLNLSIEASRIGGGSGGKALQVLAQNLRDFSNRAQEISGQQRAVILGAEQVVHGSQAQLTHGFRDIEERIHPIRERITTFPDIISGAHSHFDTVMFQLAQLTAAVQSVLKERLGKLQFQDLTRQEHEHLAALLDHFSRISPPASDPVVEHEERLALAREFNTRATTANERRVLMAWLDRHGISQDLVEVKGDDHEAGKVMLF